MTTKNTNLTDPHAIAAAAVETWRAAAKAVGDDVAQAIANMDQAAAAAANPYDNNAKKQALQADVLVARIAYLEAEDAERGARFHAALALEAIEPEDAADRELLSLCGVRQLRDRLAESLALEARLRSEFEEVLRRRQAMVGEATAAHATLSSHRAAAGLPGPLPIPPDPGTAEGFLEALSRAPVAPAPANTEIVKRLRADEVTLRAGLERARRSKEAEAKRTKSEAARYTSERARLAAENAAMLASHSAEETDRRAEDLALADAHRKGAA